MISGPLGFYTVGQRLVEAVDTAVGGMNRASMVPGEIAWDACECGLLAGSVGRLWITENFPQETASTACHAGFLVGEITLQVLRCAPVMGDVDAWPTTGELDASAQQVIQDGWRLIETVNCTLQGMEDDAEIIQYLVRPVRYAGPMGACVGPQVTVLVGLHHGSDQ